MNAHHGSTRLQIFLQYFTTPGSTQDRTGRDQKSTTFGKIPAEIVEIIFQLLSDLDRACLALSCKRLHASCISYNRQHGISVLSTLPRTLLLRRLQNERWVYCNRCQNLHQYSRWRFLGRRCHLEPAISECNSWCDV